MATDRKPLLTATNLHTLHAIEEYIAKHGQAPTIQELADACNVSFSATYAQLGTLERKGILEARAPGKARDIRFAEAS